MRNESSGAGNRRRQKFGELLESDPYVSSSAAEMDVSNQRRNTSEYSRSSISGASPAYRNSSPSPASGDCSPYLESPWNQASPFTKSPWIVTSPFDYSEESLPCNGLIGSLVREEGHVYSLAISGDLLYTGSDSKNVRVWKNLKEFAGFKSNSGLVKAIVVCGERIFTGHQDGKIRVWRLSPTPKNWTNHKRIGSLPSFKDFFKKSMNPKNYIEVRRHRNVLQIQHFDAISCIGLNKEQGLLYTGSWDKSVKVWRVANSKFLESIAAHDDAVNSVVSGFDSLVFTGSADGTVKVWRRELHGRKTKHFLAQLLLKQDSAVTALVINRSSAVLYCGSSDGLVNFWEGAKHLSRGGTLRGHKLAVLCLSTAGRLLISGSADKNICVWKREEGSGSHTCLSILTGHTGPVKCLAVDDEDEDDPWESSRVKRTKKGDDGEWVVYSGSLDRSVKVWRVSEQSPELGRASFPVSPAMMG